MGAAIRKRKNKAYEVREATSLVSRGNAEISQGPPARDSWVAPPPGRGPLLSPPGKGLLLTADKPRGSFHMAEHFDEVNPDEVVLCEAERPDWSTSDFLVFNFSGSDINHALDRNRSLDINHVFGNEVGESRHHAKETGMHKCGNFFSKRTRTVGQWQLLGNVLKLSWGKSRRVDSLLATESERFFVNSAHRLRMKVMQPTISPTWFKPDCVHQKYNSVDALAENFECPICLFELWKFPAGTLRYHSRRACSHYLHVACSQHVKGLLKGSRQEPMCPTCGAPYTEIKPMPNVFTDPRQWFAACDADFSGHLDQTEIVEGLGAVLPLARDKLEKMVRKNWRMWDKDGGGSVCMKEFLHADSGLLAFVLANVKNLQRHHHGKTIPSLDRNPHGWFEYWDRDGNGTLERAEVVRALVRTLCMDEVGTPVVAKAHHLREVAATLWETLGYSPFEALDFEEFVRPFGLMDQILHNHTQTSYFGEDDEMVLLT